jgi:uncharacterized membrane protein
MPESFDAALIAKTLPILLTVDALWLFIRADFHNKFFAGVQGAPLTVRWIPAAIVYILLAIALVVVAILGANSVRDAALRGALVGGIMYGFYDATNMATLRGWTWTMLATDTLWGAVGCGTTAAVAYHFFVRGRK